MKEHTVSKLPKIRFKNFEGNWQNFELKNVSEIRTGPFGSALHASDYVQDGVPIVTTEHFKNWNLPTRKTDLPQVSAIDYERLQNYVLKFGDIVFSRVGSIDINAHVEKIQDGWLFSGRVLRVRVNSKFNGEYLHHELSTRRVRSSVAARAVGQTMPCINTEILGSTPICVPNNPTEQTKIGEFFRELDSLIVLHQRKHDKLVALKTAMLQKMFPQAGDTTPEIRFKGFEGEWVERTLHHLADRYDNLRIPISGGNRIPGNTPYHGANGIQDYVHGYTHDGEFILVAEDGANDVKNYPVQYVTGKVWVNNHAHVLQAKEGLAETRFLQYAFSQIKVEIFLVGGGRSKLNAETMMKIELCAPIDIEEQQKIGTYFRQLDDLISKHATHDHFFQRIRI